MKDKIAVLYGPVGGNTEKVATLVAKKIGAEKCDLIPVKDVNEETIKMYPSFIIGSSTIGTHNWTHKNTSSDWDEFMPRFRNLNFDGKKVAIFGLGDQLAYPNNFVDHMRTLYDVLIESKATILGHWKTDEYEFNESAAVIDNQFVGLPVDEDYQDELTEQRVDAWLNTFLQKL
ncbi:MAG: flavodoxin [Salinivirgaceae bacterium]